MRIAYVAAGAAHMYCGSCLNDNSLVAAMQRQGTDAVLVPTYTRLRTDQADVSVDRVFLGALNVYLKQVTPGLRHGPAWLERLLDRPGLLALVSRLGSSTDPAGLGELTLSILRAEEGNQAAELEKLVVWLRDSLRPDIVHLTNSMFAGFARRLKAELGVPVVCSVQGEELFLDGLAEPSRGRVLAELAARARDVDLFIAPNRYYADFMIPYLQVDPARMCVVPLGIPLAGHVCRPPAAGAAGAEAARRVIGYLARIAPEKGLHLLAEAFGQVAATAPAGSVELRVAGYLPPPQRRYLRDIERQLGALGLGGAFRYVGEVTREQKLAFLAEVDVLAAPATYAEPKARYALEALASGVPVVAPRHGAFPELIAATGGGLLFEPGDARGLAAALTELLNDPALRFRLGQAGCAAVHAHFGDNSMAAATVAVYESCLAARGAAA